jgi:hypothetical protein
VDLRCDEQESLPFRRVFPRSTDQGSLSPCKKQGQGFLSEDDSDDKDESGEFSLKRFNQWGNLP